MIEKNKFLVVKAGEKHKTASSSMPCRSDRHQRLSGIKPPIHFPAPQQQHCSLHAPVSQVSAFTRYYVEADVLYVSPLVSTHLHSCKVEKGHSVREKQKDAER